MNEITKVNIALIVIIASSSMLFGQRPKPAASPKPKTSPYIYDKSIGPANTSAKEVRIPFKTLEITEWTGERFIFMPKKTTFQDFGYAQISPTAKADPESRLPYDDYVGKIAKVTSVEEASFFGDWEVHLIVEGTKEKLTAYVVGKTLPSIMNIRDIDEARRLYKGKVLKVRNNQMVILRQYDADSDKESMLLARMGETVTVIDVVVSWETYRPARIILLTADKKKAYLDLAFSGTNIHSDLRDDERFDEKFEIVK